MLLFAILACTPIEPHVELGTGTSSFVPLEPEAPLDLVYGPQGGWHVDVAIRCDGVDPEGALLTYAAEGPEGDFLHYPVTATLMPALVFDTDTGWERLGDRIVFDIDQPEDVLGAMLTLHVQVENGGDLTADSVDVRIQ